MKSITLFGGKMLSIKAENFAEAYSEILACVFYNYDYECSPRYQKIREILNFGITIENPYSNLFLNAKRSIPIDYLVNELILYFSGTRDLDHFGKASSFWNKIANDDGTVNSAYGHLIFVEENIDNTTQWNWAFDQLIKDKDSRQSVMHFNKPHHQLDGIKDFPCTLDVQFFIRENKLNMTTHMRSNDVIKGVTFDFPFFMILQQCMLVKLQMTYPDLEMGQYNHLSGSMHAYENDFKLIENMLAYDFYPSNTPRVSEDLVLNDNIKKLLYEYDYDGNDDFINYLAANKNA